MAGLEPQVVYLHVCRSVAIPWLSLPFKQSTLMMGRAVHLEEVKFVSGECSHCALLECTMCSGMCSSVCSAVGLMGPWQMPKPKGFPLETF